MEEMTTNAYLEKLIQDANDLEPGSEELLRQTKAIGEMKNVENAENEFILNAYKAIEEAKDRRRNTIFKVISGVVCCVGATFVFLSETDGQFFSTSVAKEAVRRIFKK